MTDGRDPIVGIDLGTTNSAVAILDAGKPRVLQNRLGHRLTPSVVAHDEVSKGYVVGRTAKDILVSHPDRAAGAFKRAMGTDLTYSLGKEKLRPEELSAYVLDSLRIDAEQSIGQKIGRVVVTVPAYFNEPQRAATKRAAEIAGLQVERLLNEPTAAAMAYGLHNQGSDQRILVFDLGGGTFDVCVMELFEGLLEVRGIAGESRLGGEDFTSVLCDELMRRADIELTHRDSNRASAMLLYRRAELLKRKLSSWPQAEVVVPDFGIEGQQEARVVVTADELGEIFSPLLERLEQPCRSALRSASLAKDDLDHIILVGGATRMPCVRALVERFFGKPPLDALDPDLVVAEGAAVQAALCEGDEAVEDIVATDIASHSLGVDTARLAGSARVENVFSPVIHRGTTIPTYQTAIYSTLEPNQRKIQFGVFEGDARDTRENVKLGQLMVRGIPKGPEGQAVEVTFLLDPSGLLEVRATILSTGKTVSEVLERAGTSLSKTELKAAQKRIERLRQNPADRPLYRDALARASMLWTDADPRTRAILGVYIENFEDALRARSPTTTQTALDELLTQCEALDGGERW